MIKRRSSIKPSEEITEEPSALGLDDVIVPPKAKSSAADYIGFILSGVAKAGRKMVKFVWQTSSFAAGVMLLVVSAAVGLCLAAAILVLFVTPAIAVGYFATQAMTEFMPDKWILIVWPMALGLGVLLWTTARRLHRAALNPLSDLLKQ